MKRVLLIWIEHPDEEWFIPLTDVSVDTLNKLLMWNGNFINSGSRMSESMYAFLYDGHGEFMYEPFKTKEPQSGNWDAIVMMGFAQ